MKQNIWEIFSIRFRPDSVYMISTSTGFLISSPASLRLTRRAQPRRYSEACSESLENLKRLVNIVDLSILIVFTVEIMLNVLVDSQNFRYRVAKKVPLFGRFFCKSRRHCERNLGEGVSVRKITKVHFCTSTSHFPTKCSEKFLKYQITLLSKYLTW